MVQYDMNSFVGAVGGSYPVFTFVNLIESSIYTENRKYSSSG